MMVPERLAIPRSSLRSGRKKRTVVKFRESAIPTSDRYVDGMNDSIKWHLSSVREQVHKAVEQLRDLLGLSSNNIRSHNMTDKKKKAVEAGMKAVDMADKGLSLVDNLASIMSAIKWIIIAVILYLVYSVGSWFVNLVPSSEDFKEAKQAVVETTVAAKDKTVESLVAAKTKTGGKAEEVATAVAESETLEAAKTKTGELVEKAKQAAQAAEVAIDESQTINDAKDDAKSIVSDLASHVPPMLVTESFKSLFGKKEEPADKSTEDEKKEGSEQ